MATNAFFSAKNARKMREQAARVAAKQRTTGAVGARNDIALNPRTFGDKRFYQTHSTLEIETIRNYRIKARINAGAAR